MRNRFFELVACLIAAPVALSGCAEDSCVVEPSAPECKTNPPAQNPDDPMSTAVQPRRIAKKSGGMLSVQVSGYSGASVTLDQGTASLALGTLNDSGHLDRGLGADALKSYAHGPATITVKKDGAETRSFSLRIYDDPSFDIDAQLQHWAFRSVKQDYGSQTLEPVALGVSTSRTIQVLGQYKNGTPPNQKQAAVYYSLNADATPPIAVFNAFELPRVFDTDVPVGFAMSGMQTTFAGSEGSASTMQTLLVRCGGSTLGSCDPSVPYAASKIAMLCGERSGQLAAGLIDGKVKAFSDYLLTQEVLLTSTPDTDVAALAVGDLNGDMAPDLAIFYKTAGRETVYLGGSSQLAKSDSYSQGLQRATQAMLGGAVPDAVQIGDLDGDQLADVVLAKEGTLSIATNQADGGFGAPISFSAIGAGANSFGAVSAIGIGPVAPAPSRVASILLASRSGGRIAVLLNQTTD